MELTLRSLLRTKLHRTAQHSRTSESKIACCVKKFQNGVNFNKIFAPSQSQAAQHMRTFTCCVENLKQMALLSTKLTFSSQNQTAQNCTTLEIFRVENRLLCKKKSRTSGVTLNKTHVRVIHIRIYVMIRGTYVTFSSQNQTAQNCTTLENFRVENRLL